jgi:hypothetical protein
LSIFFYFLWRKLCLKVTKSDHRVPRKIFVNTYCAPVLYLIIAPLLLAAKMCTNSDEFSMYIRFLWCKTSSHFDLKGMEKVGHPLPVCSKASRSFCTFQYDRRKMLRIYEKNRQGTVFFLLCHRRLTSSYS